MCHFAARIRKLFEFHFIKAMHDYFKHDLFLNELYPKFQQIIAKDNIVEKQLMDNSEEKRARDELQMRNQSKVVYNEMLKNMTKLENKMQNMNY